MRKKRIRFFVPCVRVWLGEICFVGMVLTSYPTLMILPAKTVVRPAGAMGKGGQVNETSGAVGTLGHGW